MRSPSLLFLALAISIGTLASACGGSSGGQAATAATAAASPGTPVELSDYAISPRQLTGSTGATFTVRNAGQAPHNLAIANSSGKIMFTTRELKPGQSQSLTVQLAAGDYTVMCMEPGHASLGMTGTLRITS